MSTKALIVDDGLLEAAPESEGSLDADSTVNKFALPEAVWRGTFGEYRRAVLDATEAADELHFSTLLCRVGAALGRRVRLDYGMRLYPNFYCVNFGPTGDRKTTAQRYFGELGSGDMKIISGAGSGEALADQFQGLAPGAPTVLFLEEFGELLRRGRWEGSTLLSFLTTCFDCPLRYELVFRKNGVKLDQPTPSLLAGTTPDWFWQSARLADFQGGFGNRILYFTGNRKESNPMPSMPDLTPIRKKIEELHWPAPIQARLNPRALSLWNTFYFAWEKKQRRREVMLQTAVQRVPTYVLKISMVYAALEQSLPEINEEQLGAAILVGNFCVKCAAELLSLQNAGTNPTKELERQILSFVNRQSSKQTTKRQIYKALWRHYSDATQFDRSFRALVHAGELVADSGQRGTCIVSIPST